MSQLQWSGALQQLVLPNEGPAVAKRGMYLRGRWVAAAEGLVIPPLAIVTADTFFNAFSAGKWREHSVVRTVRLVLNVQSGRGRIVLMHSSGGAAAPLEPPRYFEPGEISLEFDIERAKRGDIVFWRLEARTEVVISDARYEAMERRAREVRLACVVTAFQRDDGVARAIRSFAESDLVAAGHRLIVVDNGKTLKPVIAPWGQVIQNENLGGAGGFTRGLVLARDQGFSHCLFMDDDASTNAEAIRRTVSFLGWAKDPCTALAGAMLLLESPSLLHEAGAQLRSPFGLKALHQGEDVSRAPTLERIEAGPDPQYGGWWFFAFPVTSARKLAFPFFVRGDDVQFCRANTFRVVTMLGVASWQPGFDDKVTPATEYLAHRAEFLVGLLRQPDTLRGRLKLMRAALSPAIRDAMFFRYGNANARLDAIDDVLEGPAFFERSPSAVGRLTQIRDAYGTEFPRPLDGLGNARAMKAPGRRSKQRWIYFATLNGHLIPNVFLSRRPMAIPSLARGSRALLLRREVIFHSPRTGAGFVCRKSLRRFLVVVWRYLATGSRFLVSGGEVHAAFVGRVDYLQSEEFWRKAWAATSDALADPSTPAAA